MPPEDQTKTDALELVNQPIATCCRNLPIWSAKITIKMSDQIVECAGGIILGPDGRVVLTRKAGKPGFSFPKGHVDPEDISIEFAARREIAEETGLVDLELIGYLGSFTRRSSNGELKRIHLYLYSTEQTRLAPTDRKHVSGWLRPKLAEWVLRQHRPVDADQLRIYAGQIEDLAQAIKPALELAV